MRLIGGLASSALALALAACTASGAASPPVAPSGSASASSSPSASSPVSPAPSASAEAAGPWLRAYVTQALPPLSVFTLSDTLLITAGGLAVQSMPIPTIYPGPAVVPLGGRQLTKAGLDKIVARARALSLLSDKTDFGSPVAAGAQTGYITLTVDGKRVDIQGSPSATIQCIKAPCDPAPGTPEAFGTFWQDLSSLDWLGQDAGAQQTYDPPAYSVVVGPAPAPDPNLGAKVAIWPLSTSIGSFGSLVLNGHYRCGTVTGADAAKLGAALAKANALSQWTQSETTSATFGLLVRPLTDGQDACRDVFGVG